MVRKVFSSISECTHVWAQQTQDEGRSGNVYFSGEKIYSYGHHFCMARILPSGVAVLSSRGYSPSTGKHQSVVRGAVTHRVTVFCDDANNSAAVNCRQVEARIERFLADLGNARKQPKAKAFAASEIVRIIDGFNAYLAALPEAEQVGALPITRLNFDSEMTLSVAQFHAEQQRLKQYAEAVEISKSVEMVAEWRAGANVLLPYSLPTMLRLGQMQLGGGSVLTERVETSKEATIPINAARRLWEVIKAVRAGNLGAKDYARMCLGQYTLDRIESNGDIVVGCHNIAYSEIEMIARQLGLIPADVAASEVT